MLSFPSLKLTAKGDWKSMVGRLNVLLRWLIFRGELLVWGRVCILPIQLPQPDVSPFHTFQHHPTQLPHFGHTAKKNLRSQGHVFSVITHHKPQIPIKSRELSPWISETYILSHWGNHVARSEWHLFFQKKPSGTLEMPVIPHIFDPSCLTLLVQHWKKQFATVCLVPLMFLHGELSHGQKNISDLLQPSTTVQVLSHKKTTPSNNSGCFNRWFFFPKKSVA